MLSPRCAARARPCSSTAEVRTRTAAGAALYGARHRGVPLERAWDDVRRALPGFAPAAFLVDAITRIAGPGVEDPAMPDSEVFWHLIPQAE